MSDNRISEADVERIARRVVELLRPAAPVMTGGTAYQPQVQAHPYTGVMQAVNNATCAASYDWSTFTIGGKP